MARIDTILVRRDTAANWTSVNPVLGLGEGGYETDTRLKKTGDGVKAWNDLPYQNIRWGNITNTPTTLAGYGITDAARLTASSNAFTGRQLFASGFQASGDPGAAGGLVGAGAELGVVTGRARLTGYNRSTSATIPVEINGSQLLLAMSWGTYATDAAAGAAGLATNTVYRRSDGAGGFYLMIKA
jgi:hypothetical protein